MAISQDQLDKILKKPGYGIQSSIGKGLQSSLGQGSVKSEVSDKGSLSNVERSAGHESLLQEGATLSYTGRCSISVKVYRRRLTDPLGDCHKYHIDSLRYAGLIRDDTDAEVSVTEEPHEKVKTEAEERVEITLNYEKVYL